MAKERIPAITPQKFCKAVKGTAGIKSRIAENLNTTWQTVWGILHREGKKWDRCREAYVHETEIMGDKAEETLIDCMEQRLDLGTASRTAQFILTNRFRKRGYQNQQKIVLEGGDTPLIQVNIQQIDLSTLNLSLEVRSAILDAIEEREEEMKQIELKKEGNDKD